MNDLRAITVFAVGVKAQAGSRHVPAPMGWAGDHGTPRFAGRYLLADDAIAPRSADDLHAADGDTLFYFPHENETLRDIALRFAQGNVVGVLAANAHLNVSALDTLPADVVVTVPLQ